MKTYLFFDIESCGLLEHEHHEMVQLASLLANEEAEEMASMSMIIKPVGWTIPGSATNIHGITTAYAERVGVPTIVALKTFLMHCMIADYVIAHNIEFDAEIIRQELYKVGLGKAIKSFDSIPKYCTMRELTEFCQLPKRGRGRGYKWPKLGELFKCALNEDMEDAHTAHSDVFALKTIFYELKGRGIINI